MRHVALFYSVILTATRRIKSADLLDVAHLAGLASPKTALRACPTKVDTGFVERQA
jgi:uncharacterized protein (DUF1697 family)